MPFVVLVMTPVCLVHIFIGEPRQAERAEAPVDKPSPICFVQVKKT